jgi:DNA repair protein RadA/Sms
MAGAAADAALPARTLWIGEVGLTGELRVVGQLSDRLAEAAKLGFEKAVIPKAGLKGLRTPPGLKVSAVATLAEALEAGGLKPAD